MVALCQMIIFKPDHFTKTSDQNRLTVLIRCFIDGLLGETRGANPAGCPHDLTHALRM